MRNLNNSRGMTILEVLLALVIFSIVSVSIMSLIGNIDKMRIKNKKRDYATLIASNAAERLKYHGRYSNLNDSVYTVNINGNEYTVEYLRLNDNENSEKLHPIELKISYKGEFVKSFYLLQGKKISDDE